MPVKDISCQYILNVQEADEEAMYGCRFVFNGKSSIHTIADVELLRLHTIYKNDFISTTASGTTHFKEKQFNLVYYSTIDVKTEFVAGEYILFDITYSKDYLRRFTPYLTGLYEFLNTSESSQFSLVNHFATPEMIDAVDAIIEHKYHSNIAKFFLESKALELLTLAFEKLDQETGKLQINEEGEERAKKVRQWLDENYDNPGTLREIAMRFGTNEFKLKREFRAVFGTPIFDYLLTTKLLKAQNLLVETDKPIAEIAYETGYATPGHFSRAFKNQFGVAPKYMRKHK